MNPNVFPVIIIVNYIILAWSHCLLYFLQWEFQTGFLLLKIQFSVYRYHSNRADLISIYDFVETPPHVF